MLIKYSALNPLLQKKIYPLYVLTGTDPYLLNDAAFNIKKTWRQCGETDEKILYLYTASDWNTLLEEANSYCLFSEHVLIDVRFDKKAIDAVGKEMLTQYLQSINTRCLIILQVSAIPVKQLQWLSNHEQAMVVQITPLTASALQKWVSTQLHQRQIPFDSQVPARIYHYTQGNLLACAQIIEKLSLISDKKKPLELEEVEAQLSDQCEYQLFELTDACLNSNVEKALHLLQQSCNNRTEPTLILWLLAQEIRQLINLSHLIKQHMDFTTACSQQKIWPQRAKLYELTLNRLSLPKLYQLLQNCKELDEQIKTSQSQQIWQGLSELAMALCSSNSLSV